MLTTIFLLSISPVHHPYSTLLSRLTPSFFFVPRCLRLCSGFVDRRCRPAEALLRQVELAGGSPGSFIAQRVFRHKISKLSYQRGFSQVLIVQVRQAVVIEEGACATNTCRRAFFIAVDSTWRCCYHGVAPAGFGGRMPFWSWAKVNTSILFHVHIYIRPIQRCI